MKMPALASITKGVGDDGVDRALGAGNLALAHAVADHLAAAEFYFLTVNCEVLFDLDEEFGVGQPDLVADSRPIHLGVGGTRDSGHQRLLPKCGVVEAGLHIAAIQWSRNDPLGDTF
ncbi:hypothetical protein ACVINZ_004273 [Mesorhizobium jarvisii]